MKNTIKSILNLMHLDLTKNLKYDRLTKLIMKRVIGSDSNCIDIGCHKGEILDIILNLSPNGKHFGFEPLPFLFNELNEKYKNNATIYPYALSDQKGITQFQYVKNAPAYSGLKKRKYDMESPEIEEINVELNTLDELISHDIKIDFVKIDVEGAEYGVLNGGKQLLKKNKPVIVFECGLGASDYYEKSPVDIYNLITKEICLNISSMNSFLNSGKCLELREFESLFSTNKEYYFIAHPD